MIFPYLIHILILIGIYLILAVSLNLSLGYAGLLSLGHVALFGIGAYTSALLNINGVPFVFSFLLAGLLAGFFGFLLAFATGKLKGDYYALASLGFAFVVYSLLLNLTEITRGPLGIPGISKPQIFGWAIKDNFSYLIFLALVCFVSIFLINKIVNSGFGKLLGAMRDDETGLRILGKDTKKLKYKTMFVSGFFAGISGSLFAHYIGFIDPNTFYISELVLILTIVILGGIASLKGSITATFVVIVLSELMRFLPLPSAIIGPGRQIVYAIVLIIILMFRPRGLLGRIDLE
ncbi:branched-chain amino acid ABC transporter permease [Candidatus Pacearchaeota archaeon]|nr:branched-chain amino acid ABC transporter permease [Candidatus Pacearchaeota archaeon]